MVSGGDRSDSGEHGRLIGLGDAAFVGGTLKEADVAFLSTSNSRAAPGTTARSRSDCRSTATCRGRGRLAGALTSYRVSFAIIDRLARADPDNANWQRDLSVSYNKVGDVQRARATSPGR